MKLWEITVVIGSALLVGACGSDAETTSPSVSTQDQSGSPSTTAQPAEPPPEPSTVGKVEIRLAIESQQGSSTVIRSQLVNRSDTPALDSRMQIMQRWQSGEWLDTSVLPYTSGSNRAVPACDPAQLEECEIPADDPGEVEPGEHGKVRLVVVDGLEPGVYRVIEPVDIREQEFRADPRVVSGYLEIGP